MEIQESPSFLELRKEFINLFWLLSLVQSVCRILVLRGCFDVSFFFCLVCVCLLFVWFGFVVCLFVF